MLRLIRWWIRPTEIAEWPVRSKTCVDNYVNYQWLGLNGGREIGRLSAIPETMRRIMWSRPGRSVLFRRFINRNKLRGTSNKNGPWYRAQPIYILMPANGNQRPILYGQRLYVNLIMDIVLLDPVDAWNTRTRVHTAVANRRNICLERTTRSVTTGRDPAHNWNYFWR